MSAKTVRGLGICLVALSLLASTACTENVTNEFDVQVAAGTTAAEPSVSGSGSAPAGSTGATGSTGSGSTTSSGNGSTSGSGAPSGNGSTSGNGTGGTTPRTPAFAGLFTTGVDGTGAPLPAGSVDPHYTLTSNDPQFPGPQAIVAENADPPDGGWVPNTSTSGWISVQANTEGNVDIYTFTTTFTLTGVDPTTASLSGTWSCDDSCTMSLNGTQVASAPSPAWTSVQPFTIPAGSPFQNGTNTLTIAVNNSGNYATGLQILTIAGSATASSSAQ